jgi:hypothetical protein
MSIVREKTLKHTPFFAYFKFFLSVVMKYVEANKKPRIGGALK